MLKIRKEQMEILNKAMYKKDIQTLAQQLQARGFLAELSEADVIKSVESGIAKATHYGIQDMDDMLEFMSLLHQHGESFFENPEIQVILHREEAAGNVKMILIQDYLTKIDA